MSDTPSSTTPRMGDTSAADSNRAHMEQQHTAAVGNNNLPSNGIPKVSFNTLPQSGNGLVFDETSFRRQSPESDAITSSDDEEHKLGFFSKNTVSQLSSRRPSYAAEFHTRQRTYSISSGGPLSPTASHPATPQGDATNWSAGTSANTSGGPTLGPFWGGGSIWNSDRKSPPKQFNQTNGAQAHPLFSGSEALPSPTSGQNGDFPIPIPLQPQFRNYRSMSFSVGQQNPEEPEQSRPRLSPPSMHGSRLAQPGLQHRPSRPSLLSGEQFAESPLQSVFEAENEESAKFGEVVQPQTSYFQNHAPFSRKYDLGSFRGRSASAATIPVMQLQAAGLMKDGDRIDEYESALAEEDDEYNQYRNNHNENRRFSEAPPRGMGMMFPGAENQRLGDIRQTWQTGGLLMSEAGNQSRRHSFAGLGADFSGGNDLLGKQIGPRENGNLLGRTGNNYLSVADVSRFENARKDSLYVNENARMQPRQSFSGASRAGPNGPLAAVAPPQHHMPQLQSYQQNARAVSPPHRSLMGGMNMHAQPRNQLLYFVTFKAMRGDVFYVQEGTGLRVNQGDLVIVEADRGTDLGTVYAVDISWARAKELKEQYAQEQYKCLMMYATRGRNTATGTSAGAAPSLNSSFAGSNPNGPMGQHGQNQDGQSTELKPKMIKRLAQTHEIQTLRDKEANEAKAKRVCQQKVMEHRLPMEILDAEFQMDWKKLTFYYFADSYINFNSLVTDLFKVYKTRIWMSAMNPASFASHTTGASMPQGGLGPIVESSGDGMPPHYGGAQGPVYGSYVTGMNGRGPSQQQQSIPQQVSLTGFPNRHSPTTAEFLAQNGYGAAAYLNGAAANGLAAQQFAMRETHAGNGVQGNENAIWMGLQGLSLNSH